VFFWTRFPEAFLRPGPLRDVLRLIENPFVHLTLTGLGGTHLEPRVPPTDEVLRLLPSLIAEFRGEPERIRWRLDPLLREYHTPDILCRLFEACSRLGLTTCIVSLPATRSLKGDLTPQLLRTGIIPPSPTEGCEFAARVADIAASFGIRLMACATPALEPLIRSGIISRSQCIAGELASRLHPRGLPADLPKDPHQRKACACVLSEDIGSYSDHRCLSGCAYCYSKAGGPGAFLPSRTDR